VTDSDLDAVAGRVFSSVLADTHLTRPVDVADALAEHAVPLGLEDLVVYLVDYEQENLIPVPRLRSPAERPVLRIDGTAGGIAFAQASMQETDAGDDGHRRCGCR
jgi:hypothetical protein